jgi:hypothetical protein
MPRLQRNPVEVDKLMSDPPIELQGDALHNSAVGSREHTR